MNPNQPNQPPHDDDPWEQLAENLFGITYGKEHASTELREIPPDVPAPEAAAETPRPAEEFLGFAEETTEVVAADPEPGPAFAAEPPPMTTAPPVPAASPQDAYWDALANWSWDDSEGRAPRREEAPREAEKPPTEESRPPRREAEGRSPRDRRDRDRDRGRRGDRGDRPSRGPQQPQSRPAPQRAPAPEARSAPARPDEDDSFGDGLFGNGPDVAWQEPAAEIPALESAEPETEDDDFFQPEAAEEGAPSSCAEPGRERFEDDEGPSDDRPRRRRRRRRRRSRGPDSGQPAGQSAAPAGEGELAWPDDEDAEVAAEREPEERMPPARAPEPETRRPSGRGRGRDDRRRRRNDDEFTEVAWEDEEPISSEPEPRSEPFLEEGDVDEDDSEQVVSYANIPTWEEAISYLLHPEQVQSDTPSTGSGGGSRGGSSGSEGRRPNRYYGRGKGRG